MEKVRQFLQGKKTYISAAALALVAISGCYFGAIDNTNAAALLTMAGAIAGLGAKSNRAAQAILVALSNVRDAQEAHARGQKIDLAKLGEDIAKQVGLQVIPGIVPINVSGLAASAATIQGESLQPISSGDIHVHVNGATSPQLVKDIVSAVRAAQIQAQPGIKS